ncbi:MAG: L-aspartate oxidase [Gemmataceae bacterium]
MSPARRYLTRFHPKRVAHFFTDVLIIGGGIAGLRAALEVPPELDVLVITKDKIAESNSSYAQGGIAGVLSDDDRFENHIEDTIAVGGGLCDRNIVELVVRKAPNEIGKLIDWDTHFDLEDGHLALTREGGHSHRRIVHALGDSTGHEVMRAIITRAKEASNVAVWEKAFTLDLLTDETNRRCVGAVVDFPGASRSLVWAKQTVLASGGAGMVYRETTNPSVATGDGMAAAYRAGAQLRDMEFMQFHPTVLYVAGSSRFLISEAVRGEGAHLVDKHGRRFMPDVDERAELAPRDVVAQAIFQCMEQTRHPNVYLDLAHLDEDLVMRRFPGIARVCRRFGIDITKDRIPIRPGAHYMIGGVAIDEEGRTTLPGLWAAGEVTSTGLHGANRLASNSLLEGLVYGALCGRGAARAAAEIPDRFQARPITSTYPPDGNGTLDVTDITNSLRSLMVRQMGVVRDRPGMMEAAKDVAFWRNYVLQREFDNPAGWELQNMLTVAQCMIQSAIQREESRGVHYRSDFPDRDDARWQQHIVCPPLW